MADIVMNIAKGKVAHLASLPATNDALVAVPLEAAGLVADATMADYDTLAEILAGASNEQTTIGRKTLASVTVTVDDVADDVEVDSADFAWTAATGNAVGCIVICYDPDTTGGSDADLIPLTKHDVAFTPDGTDVQVPIASGIYNAV